MPTPLVVLPPEQDPARRQQLAALLPSPTRPPSSNPPPTALPEAPAATQVPGGNSLSATAPPPATPGPINPAGRGVGGRVADQAAEIKGIKAWINSEPLTISGLRGKVVLVDFWTYTCINCIRTMPYLKLWHSRYQDDGLVILGVHSPEFVFEREVRNVVKATKDYRISWPVALDNGFATWAAYSNRFWPAKYLVDKDGVVRYTHFGEGKYAEIEAIIRDLLAEAGADLSDDRFTLPADQAIDPAFLASPNAEVTRELYAGYERGRSDLLFGRGGYVLQNEFYQAPDSVVYFVAPGELLPHAIYFDGLWRIGPESAKHGQSSTNYEDNITLVYSAQSVNAVLTSESGQPYQVRVTAGGKYLTEENKGRDIIIGKDGESYLLVTDPRMYSIVENPSYIMRQTLSLSSNSDDFGLFAFTFGVYQKAS